MSDVVDGAVYIVGEYIAKTEHGAVWDFCGVFDDKEKAESVCLNERYFVCMGGMNVVVPTEREEWPHCYYPKLAQKESGAG